MAQSKQEKEHICVGGVFVKTEEGKFGNVITDDDLAASMFSPSERRLKGYMHGYPTTYDRKMGAYFVSVRRDRVLGVVTLPRSDFKLPYSGEPVDLAIGNEVEITTTVPRISEEPGRYHGRVAAIGKETDEVVIEVTGICLNPPGGAES